MALYHAALELKGDREIVLASIGKDGRALQFASSELKGDREIVLAALGKNGRTLQFAASELKGDREIVLAAVGKNGRALQYAASGLKGDREIVLAAVAQKAMALEYATARLKLHRALQWISTTNLALHCTQLRLALATCALPTPLRSVSILSALPRDLIELIGTYILPDVAICVVARMYGYWCDGGSPIRGAEDLGRKKRKRLHEDDVV